MKPHHLTIVPLLAAFALLPLQAGEEYSAIPPDEPYFAGSSGSGDWEVTLSPFAWFTEMKGIVGEGALAAPVDVDFGDIWDNGEMAFLAAAEVRRGRWSLQTILVWLDLSASDTNGGLAYDSVGLDMEQTILDLRLAYRILEGRTSAELVAGARYMAVDADTSFRGGLLGGTKIHESEDWIDPLVGVRLSHEFNDKWHGVLHGDYGGFGVSSDSAWEVFGGLGYRVTDSVTIFGGYRYLEVDYDRDFIFDAEIKGFVLGAQFEF